MGKIILVLSLIAIASVSFAGSGYLGNRNIIEITASSCDSPTDRGINVKFDSSHDNPAGCQKNDQAIVACNHTNYDSLTSLLLSAHVSGRKVNGWLTSSCASTDEAILNSVIIK